MNLSSFCSVPAKSYTVNPQGRVVETIHTCPECWLDTSAVVSFFGRELCPDCAGAEEAAYEEAQISAYEAAEFGRHDQMSSLKDVLVDMGF